MTNIHSKKHVCDVIIIGGGPAGLTAGIYSSRAKLKTLLIESAFNPSQVTITDLIENYPGFPEGIQGPELIEKFKEQASKFGLDIIQKDVSVIARTSIGNLDGWKVETGDSSYVGLSIIMVTGTTLEKLGVTGETEFTGRGVSYCATCDAPFYKDRRVIVVGGGDAAIQESIYLTKFAKEVFIIHRRDRLRATGILQERAFSNNQINFVWNSVVEKIIGDNVVSGVQLENVKTGKFQEIAVDGVFVFVGNVPNSELVNNLVELDKGGSIIVNKGMKTSADGIFACGDCTNTSLRQVVTACGDGATAAYSAQLYVEKLKDISYNTD
jgi:thioredoxin reductase (NADPH)